MLLLLLPLPPPRCTVIVTPHAQDDPAASAAVSATMAQLDFGALLKAVDDGFRSWRQPSLVLFGANDPFVDVKSAFAFLDSKRTSMRMVTATAKLGHMPQVGGGVPRCAHACVPHACMRIAVARVS